MVKQFRSDGTEIRDGESAVPGYVPFHMRYATEGIAEGEAAPPASPPDWVEDIPPVRPELLNAIDPGEPTPILTSIEASDNNVQRVVDLVTSHLCHDHNYAPLKLREQVTTLILAINRLIWASDALRAHEYGFSLKEPPHGE